ncbi:Cyclin-T1-2, partial [Ananas comosus]
KIRVSSSPSPSSDLGALPQSLGFLRSPSPPPSSPAISLRIASVSSSSSSSSDLGVRSPLIEFASGYLLSERMAMDEDCATVDELYNERMRSWYFSRQEIENNSPSRKDGIDRRKESELRMLYCSFIGDVGRRLKLPQISIATAIMFCHRFYLHQSHAKNEWQTIATVCIFLAAKVEDTPCALDSVVRILVPEHLVPWQDVFEKQKALILIGERLLLSTERFDFNVQHPYKPLLDALNKLRITRKDVRQAPEYTGLQYKPHYIAQAAIREMMELYASSKDQWLPHLEKPIVEAPAGKAADF